MIETFYLEFAVVLANFGNCANRNFVLVGPEGEVYPVQGGLVLHGQIGAREVDGHREVELGAETYHS